MRWTLTFPQFTLWGRGEVRRLQCIQEEFKQGLASSCIDDWDQSWERKLAKMHRAEYPKKGGPTHTHTEFWRSAKVSSWVFDWIEIYKAWSKISWSQGKHQLKVVSWKFSGAMAWKNVCSHQPGVINFMICAVLGRVFGSIKAFF